MNSATPAGGARSSEQASASSSKAGRKAPASSASDTSALTYTAPATAESSQLQAQDTPRKSWLNQDELLKGANQLPQVLKDFSSKAADQFNNLSTQQKVIGGALLVSGLSWLALRSKKTKSSSDIYAPYVPKGESKWKSSNESVYRGASAGLHHSDTTYGTENGF